MKLNVFILRLSLVGSLTLLGCQNEKSRKAPAAPVPIPTAPVSNPTAPLGIEPDFSELKHVGQEFSLDLAEGMDEKNRLSWDFKCDPSPCPSPLRVSSLGWFSWTSSPTFDDPVSFELTFTATTLNGATAANGKSRFDLKRSPAYFEILGTAPR